MEYKFGVCHAQTLGDSFDGKALADPYHIESSVLKNTDWFSTTLFSITYEFGRKKKFVTTIIVERGMTYVEQINLTRVPKHIAIIMDGNGPLGEKNAACPARWGTRAGAEVFRDIATYCKELGVEYLTVYAFSTENWSRPKEEVDAIMDLLRQYLKESLKDFQAENIRTRFIGDFAPLEPDIRQLMREAGGSPPAIRPV